MKQQSANAEPPSFAAGTCPPNYVPLLELHDTIRSFVAKWATEEIEKHKSPTSVVSHWPETFISDRSLVSIQRRVREKSLLTIGLEDYLLAQFLDQNRDKLFLVLGNSLLRRDPTALMYIVGDYDLSWIDFRGPPAHTRSRLIEIGGNRSYRYAFIDPESWSVRDETAFLLPRHEGDDAGWNAARKQIVGLTGAFLVMKGKLPSHRVIEGLLGATARFSQAHILELVQQASSLYATCPPGQFTRQKLSDALGIGSNPRHFNNVWRTFLGTLPPDDRAALSKPGRRTRRS